MGDIDCVDLGQDKDRWQEFHCASKETNKLVVRCNHNCLKRES